MHPMFWSVASSRPPSSVMAAKMTGGKQTRTLVRHYVRTDLIERKTQVLRSWDERLPEIVAGRGTSKVVSLFTQK